MSRRGGNAVPDGRSSGRGDEELDKQTGRLRGLGIRAAVVAAIWLLCLPAGFLLLIAAGRSADQLLHTGTRVPGQVESAAKGKSSAIKVRYHPLGTQDVRRVSISWDSSRSYSPGDAVIVVYDPADPTRVRTTEEENFDERTTWAPAAALFVGAFLGTPFSLSAVFGWRRRYRAVRATGWRRATATVTVLEGKPCRRKESLIRVEYAGGGGIEVDNAVSTHAARGPAGQSWDVRVGGRGDDLVLLYPRGRLRARPLAVPAKRR